MQLLLSSNTVHLMFGRSRMTAKCFLISFSSPRSGIILRKDYKSAIYSVSVVDSAISVWSLLAQTRGRFPYVIANPVCKRTLTGFSNSACDQFLEKFASKKHSIPAFLSGKKHKPLLLGSNEVSYNTMHRALMRQFWIFAKTCTLSAPRTPCPALWSFQDS